MISCVSQLALGRKFAMVLGVGVASPSPKFFYTIQYKYIMLSENLVRSSFEI